MITSSVAEGGGTLPRNTHGMTAAAESVDQTANGVYCLSQLLMDYIFLGCRLSMFYGYIQVKLFHTPTIVKVPAIVSLSFHVPRAWKEMQNG